MLVKYFMQEIENTYYNYFPKSRCYVRFSKNIYSSISISCYLANNEAELSGGYWENDMFSIRFYINTETGEFDKDIAEDSDLPGNLNLEADRKSYSLKPDIEFMAYGRRQLTFRKTKGEPYKILNSLDKFFNRLHQELQNDINDGAIHENYIDLLLEKI